MTQQLTIEEKLSRARTQLLLNQPFFGTLCLRLKLVLMPSFPTMATDGRRLVYNPAFVEKLTPAELEGVLAHEVMHCALAHHCRRGELEAQLRGQRQIHPAEYRTLAWALPQQRGCTHMAGDGRRVRNR